ncbi:MAG: DUF899 family protein [Pseudomonadota bacterium]
MGDTDNQREDNREARIAGLEQQIFELTQELHSLRKVQRGKPVPNYSFDVPEGNTTLLDLFGQQQKLLAIHNMGQGCRYCTLWADGFNGLLPHLESTLAVVLVSRDPPAEQRRFANSRGWRFRLASHGGGAYIHEQTVMADQSNMPGAVVYARDGDTILRHSSCVFGPGDLYCPAWHLLGLAGISEADWTPQFNYWQRPAQLDDGGANVID